MKTSIPPPVRHSKTPLGEHPFDCFDCGQIADGYMVHRYVWNVAWPDYIERTRERTQKFRKWKAEFEVENEQPPLKLHIKQWREKNWKHLVLCFGCLETRLGRNLTIDDFTEVNSNRGIRLGLVIAQRQHESPSSE